RWPGRLSSLCPTAEGVQWRPLAEHRPAAAVSLGMRRQYGIPLGIVLTLLFLLVVLHFALPSLVRNYLNDKLADMGDYQGQITDVDLAWWRGAYRINGL